MGSNDVLKLNNIEKEILILKAVWELISNAVNFATLDLHHKDPDSSIMFKTGYHQKYFSIILVDLLSKPAGFFEIKESYLFALQEVCNDPNFNCTNTIGSLRKSVDAFQEWLDKDVSYDSEHMSRKLWFPSIDKEINLKIYRSEFIKICGNISKHSFSRLTGISKKIVEIFKRSNEEISLTDALMILEEFYGQFHDDIFIYHGSSIAEFLNEIRWGIYEYLQPEFKNSIVMEEPPFYRYTYPPNLENKYAKTLYWDLMNEIRSQPYMPRFKVTRNLKGLY